MNIFVKATSGILITLVLYLILVKESKDFSYILTVAACCIIASCALNYLKPVVDFFSRLQTLAKLDSAMLSVIVKSVGIGILTEIVGLICTDAGNAALGKTLQILASSLILWMSIPLFEAIITLVEEILVAI